MRSTHPHRVGHTNTVDPHTHTSPEPHSPLQAGLAPAHRVGWTTWWLWRGDRTRSHPELGRENPQRPWYCVSRRGRVGRCQVFQPIRIAPGAGWSSPVARQAHNLKAAGSNPAPATNVGNTRPEPPLQRSLFTEEQIIRFGGTLQRQLQAPSLVGGGGGIRTRGSLRPASFQDWCLKPLGHPSGASPV